MLLSLVIGAAVEAKFTVMRSARDALRPAVAAAVVPASPYTFDRFGRLVSFTGKTQVPCPKQGPRTEVLLALGQSNAANHAGQRYRTAHGARVVNFFDGRCYLAASPLLGSSGSMGETWTLLANRMVDAGASEVVIASSAIGSTSIAEWTTGRLAPLIPGVLADLRRSGFSPTRIAWVQGESDFLAGTSSPEYSRQFAALLRTLRTSSDAAVYVTVSTRGEPYPGWTRDNPVAVAQRSLPGVHLAADTDELVTPDDRYDGVHFAASGQEKFADHLLRAFGYSALTVAR